MENYTIQKKTVGRVSYNEYDPHTTEKEFEERRYLVVHCCIDCLTKVINFIDDLIRK